jgi:hypothetical protein
MQAAEMLTHLSGMGISLTPGSSGKIEARPKSALTGEARRLIRGHKAALLAALAEEVRIRTWLQSIGEDDSRVIGEILERARTELEARNDYL